jgi:hypothetical protein
MYVIQEKGTAEPQRMICRFCDHIWTSKSQAVMIMCSSCRKFVKNPRRLLEVKG